MFNQQPTIPQSVPMQAELTQLHVEQWRANDLFHPIWWALLGLLILFAAVWLALLDKKRAKRVCLYAAICAVFSMGMFEYGDELVLWDYPVDLIPIFPPLTSVNLILRPLMFSILFQRFLTWKSFLAAALVASATLCFALEPLFALSGMYELINWSHFFNFFIYTGFALLARLLTLKVISMAQRYGPQPGWAP